MSFSAIYSKKNQIFMFRVTIYVKIWVILTQIETLIKEIIPD